MSNFRRLLLEQIDDVHEKNDGKTPDHVILPNSIKEDVRLEKLDTKKREFQVTNDEFGLIGMQVWFSSTLDHHEKKALLLSDEVFVKLFSRTKDFERLEPKLFYTASPYYLV